MTDYASSDTFTDVLYDEARKQVYLSADDHIDVLSISSGQFLTPLKPANLNGTSSFRGLALTPDGSLLLAANMTDGSLGVINLLSLANLRDRDCNSDGHWNNMRNWNVRGYGFGRESGICLVGIASWHRRMPGE